MILFTGIFSLIILKKKLTVGQWIALAVVVFALFIVGLSGALFAEKTADQQTFSLVQILSGIFLVLAGSACNGFQNVCEEKLLKAISYAEVDSLEVVGWEGLFGSLMSMFIMVSDE